MTDTRITPEAAAEKFVATLREWLTADEFAEMQRLNTAKTDPNVCHSHDFCDANMAMLDALESFDGVEFVAEWEIEEAVTDDERKDAIAKQVIWETLWNAAWSIAAEGALRTDEA